MTKHRILVENRSLLGTVAVMALTRGNLDLRQELLLSVQRCLHSRLFLQLHLQRASCCSWTSWFE